MLGFLLRKWRWGKVGDEEEAGGTAHFLRGFLSRATAPENWTTRRLPPKDARHPVRRIGCPGEGS